MPHLTWPASPKDYLPLLVEIPLRRRHLGQITEEVKNGRAGMKCFGLHRPLQANGRLLRNDRQSQQTQTRLVIDNDKLLFTLLLFVVLLAVVVVVVTVYIQTDGWIDTWIDT